MRNWQKNTESFHCNRVIYTQRNTEYAEMIYLNTTTTKNYAVVFTRTGSKGILVMRSQQKKNVYLATTLVGITREKMILQIDGLKSRLIFTMVRGSPIWKSTRTLNWSSNRISSKPIYGGSTLSIQREFYFNVLFFTHSCYVEYWATINTRVTCPQIFATSSTD